MIEVMPNLFVGGTESLTKKHLDIRTGMHQPPVMDADGNVTDGWYVISAARDPWHRQALGGYVGRGAPKDHAEYLIALRPNRLILNLVDVADPAYIRDEIISAALAAIDDAFAQDRKVLIHCNQGQSRAPTIAMLYMAKHGPLREMLPFEVVEAFKRIYPSYAPADGMRLYAQRWLDENLTAA